MIPSEIAGPERVNYGFSSRDNACPLTNQDVFSYIKVQAILIYHLCVDILGEVFHALLYAQVIL